MKPKFQWKLQNVQHAKIMKCPPRKEAGTELDAHRENVPCVVYRIGVAVLLKSFESKS